MKVTTPACLFGAWCAEKIKTVVSNGKALDIGTGTGLLSLMIAQKNPLQIDAVEIDSAAADQAEENVRAAGFGSIKIINADVTNTALPVYDIIFSNPPFYESEWKSPDAGRNLAHHSERLSWEELFSFINDHLTGEGSFYLLLPAKRSRELQQLMIANQLYANEMIQIKPTTKQEAMWIMVEGTKTAVSPEINEMTIRDEVGYTTAFIALLKDYYLKL